MNMKKMMMRMMDFDDDHLAEGSSPINWDTDGDWIVDWFEVNDDEAYKDVWKGEMPLRASQEKIYEYACHEGNYAMANILAGARAEEEN